MKNVPLDADDVALDPFRDPTAWTAAPRRQAMLLGPDRMVLRLIRNRRTLRVALSFPKTLMCAHRGGLWRSHETLGAGPVQADLFPGPTEAVVLRLADLAWGQGARETRALLGRLAQALAPEDRGRDPADTGVAEAAEIGFGGRGVTLRIRRRHAIHPGVPFHGPWRDLPPALSARVLLAVPPTGGGIAALAAAPVPQTAHGRASLRADARADVASLGDDPTPLFGDVP